MNAAAWTIGATIVLVIAVSHSAFAIIQGEYPIPGTWVSRREEPRRFWFYTLLGPIVAALLVLITLLTDGLWLKWVPDG